MSGFQYFSQRSLRSSGATLRSLPLCGLCVKPKPDTTWGSGSLLFSGTFLYLITISQKYLFINQNSMNRYKQKWLLLCCTVLVFISCKNKNENQYKGNIDSLDLKRGEVVGCGPQEGQFGVISFSATVPEKLRNDFNTAIALLHSFEYDESEKMFAKVIDQAPGCAMA